MEFRPRKMYAEHTPELHAPPAMPKTAGQRVVDFDYLSRVEDARWQARADGEPDSDERLRDRLRNVLSIEKQRDAIAGSIAELRGQIDAAVLKHQEIVAPLQQLLSQDDLATSKRIKARMQVDQANAGLERELEPLQAALKAAETEHQLLNVRCGASRQVIENSFVNNGPDAVRIHALQRAADALRQGPVDAARRKADEAEGLVAENERYKAEHRGRDKFAAPEQLESKARELREISRILAGFEKACHDELRAIRERRVAELYQGIE